MDINKIRKDFPILRRTVNGKRLVYLDNAATSQKPQAVLDALENYYREHNANVHRGVYTLSEEATALYEGARKKVADFISAPSVSEIIFTRNATEAINLVAYSWGRKNIRSGDEIIVSGMEHHSNLVPWQILAEETGSRLVVWKITEEGKLDISKLEKLVNGKTKLLAVAHVSNVLGTINPVEEIMVAVKKINPKTRLLIDGAQAVPHMKVNVARLGADWYAATGHKMLGPTGIGFLWGKKELLEAMGPFLSGGEMIKEVTWGKTTYNDLPWKFEAGTPNIAGAIGLGAAIDYLEKIGMDEIRKHEVELSEYLIGKLKNDHAVTVYGPQKSTDRSGVISFNLKSVHAHDLAAVADSFGVAIRSGHHCAQPLINSFGEAAAARASFYLYNDRQDIDGLLEAIEKAKEIFKLSSKHEIRISTRNSLNASNSKQIPNGENSNVSSFRI